MAPKKVPAAAPPPQLDLFVDAPVYDEPSVPGIPKEVTDFIEKHRDTRPPDQLTLTIERRRAALAKEMAEAVGSTAVVQQIEAEIDPGTLNLEPGEFQGELNLGLAAVPEKKKHRDGRVAFGRFLKTWLFDANNDYCERYLTPKEKYWITARSLAEGVGVRRTFKQESPDVLRIDGIYLNQYEYKLIPRSPSSLGRAIFSHALGEDRDINKDVIDTAERGVVHGLDRRVPALDAHKELLQERLEEIKKLKRFAATPGFRRSQELDMVQLLSGAWSELTNMLDVMQLRYKWDDETRLMANMSLIHHLTTGKQSIKVKRWDAVLQTCEQYLASRINLIAERTESTKSVRQVYTTSSNG